MSGEWDGLRKRVALVAGVGGMTATVRLSQVEATGLLDRLEAAEAAEARVRAVVEELRRPDRSLAGRIMSPSFRAVADALEGYEGSVTSALGVTDESH